MIHLSPGSGVNILYCLLPVVMHASIDYVLHPGEYMLRDDSNTVSIDISSYMYLNIVATIKYDTYKICKYVKKIHVSPGWWVSLCCLSPVVIHASITYTYHLTPR